MGIVLSITLSDGETQEVNLGSGTYIIGRSRSANLQIKDKLLSGKHMAIEISPDKITVKDLDSTNGTFINGNQINIASLYLDDELQLGTTVISINPNNLSHSRREALTTEMPLKYLRPREDITVVKEKKDITKSEKFDIHFSLDFDDDEDEVDDIIDDDDDDIDYTSEPETSGEKHLHSLDQLTGMQNLKEHEGSGTVDQHQHSTNQDSSSEQPSDEENISAGASYLDEGDSVVRSNYIDLDIDESRLTEEVETISLEKHSSKSDEKIEHNKRKKRAAELRIKNLSDKEEEKETGSFFGKFFSKK